MTRNAGFLLARNFCCTVAITLLAAASSAGQAQTPGEQKSVISSGSDPMHRSAMVYRVGEGIPRLIESSAEPSMTTTWIGEAGQLSVRRHLLTGLMIGAAVGAVTGAVVSERSGECSECGIGGPWFTIPVFAVGGAIAGTLVGGVVYIVRSRQQ